MDRHNQVIKYVNTLYMSCNINVLMLFKIILNKSQIDLYEPWELNNG